MFLLELTRSGNVNGTNRKIPGFPFIGKLYPKVKKKILFVGLDIGSDEGDVHTFDSRREVFSKYYAKGEIEIPAKKPFNPHVSGTYAMAFALLYDTIGREDSWKRFSSNKDATAYRAIQKYHSSIPVELLDYTCFTNAHKFVTQNRQHKSGAQDRVWGKFVPKETELQFLEDEIAIIQPEIIIFQGKEFDSIVPRLQLEPKIRTLITFHPSSRNKQYRSIGYIEDQSKRVR